MQSSYQAAKTTNNKAANLKSPVVSSNQTHASPPACRFPPSRGGERKDDGMGNRMKQLILLSLALVLCFGTLVFAEGSGASAGTEVFSRKLNFHTVRDATLSYDGGKVYFAGKETGTGSDELYSYSLPCDNHPTKITDFGTFATQNPDVSPVSDILVFEALAGEGTAHLHTVVPGRNPVKISGDEQLPVEGADDPTVSWGDHYPAWSPDGRKIAYARLCEDVVGPNLPTISAVVTMNPDGSDKQVVYANQDDKKVENVCWSYDRAFIFFTLRDNDSTGHRHVKALHLASKTLSDLDSGFINGPGGNPDVNSLSSSPDALEIIYTPHDVNPDLYKVTLANHDGHLTVQSAAKLTDGMHYRNPNWR